MKQIAITITALALWIGAFGQNNSCQDLIISEMIEGNAPNRALELFNPSDDTIDLADFSIRLFQNGQLTPLIIPLSGTLAPKSTFVIAHPAAKPEIKSKADMLDAQLTFGGNDAIVLERNGGTQVDKIGEIGVNPGNSGWFVPPNGSTKEQTLRRKYPVDKGETDWNVAKNQWTVHPKDSVSNLKQHQNVCTQGQVIVSFDVTSTSYDEDYSDIILPAHILIKIKISGVHNYPVEVILYENAVWCSNSQTATSSDYILWDSFVTFPANDNSAQFAEFSIIDDTNSEPDEYVCLELVSFDADVSSTNYYHEIKIIDNDPIGVNETFNEKIKVYPSNPDNFLSRKNINYQNSYSVAIFNSLGQRVSTDELSASGNEFNLNVSSLSNGLYTVQIIGLEDNSIYTTKFFKR